MGDMAAGEKRMIKNDLKSAQNPAGREKVESSSSEGVSVFGTTASHKWNMTDWTELYFWKCEI